MLVVQQQYYERQLPIRPVLIQLVSSSSEVDRVNGNSIDKIDEVDDTSNSNYR